MAYTKDKDEPIYTISVAAKLVRPAHMMAAHKNGPGKPIHAQTLRMYERKSLVKPHKVGKNRFYSDHDIERLQQIQHFTQDIGINLAGVAYIFAMLEQMHENELDWERIEAMLRRAEDALPQWIKDETE
ncbi:MAG: MerR family transcriptional regulator [Armatimonadota bacterium]|nr:MerR family transcriptional regulator [Armatimonadota bacterium]